jgi:hypothetical protein
MGLLGIGRNFSRETDGRRKFVGSISGGAAFSYLSGALGSKSIFVEICCEVMAAAKICLGVDAQFLSLGLSQEASSSYGHPAHEREDGKLTARRPLRY